MDKSKNCTPMFDQQKSRLTTLFLVILMTAFGVMKITAQNGSLSQPAERVQTESKRNNIQNEKGKDTFGFPNFSDTLSDLLLSSNDLITPTTYVFSTQTGVALEDMSSGTTQLIGPSTDDTNSTLNNIGFEFWFDGVRFTQFGVNGNGFARLGAASTGTSFSNSIATTTNAPKIMPFWDDLCVGSNGKVHFKTIGSAPNRKLVIEFLNMQITRGGACAGTGGGTFQMWLFESAGATSPGVIQFVYGTGITGSNDGGYSVGLQSGAATNFASVSTLADTVSYTTANNTQTDAIASGKSYLFTPNIPAAPSGINFTAVGPTSLTVNWTDNSSNEFGFAVYRSTDGTNFTFAGQTAADATSFNETGLNPSTNYTYRVFAVTEGAFSSPALQGSQMTAPPGNDTCAGAGGNWDAPATWTDGSVPTVSDNVTIGAGCTVTVNVTNAVALNLTINSGGTLQSPLTGTVTTNNLTVSGNVTNNGTLDFSTNGDTSGAILTFGAGGNNVTFGGTGATTDVRAITVAKGAQSTVVELTTSNFTVRGVNTDAAGYLTLTSGTFKISGSFTMVNRTFPGPTYTVPLLGGFWLNNPNYTVAATASGTTTSYTGLLRLTQGTYNVGLTGADGLGGGTGATFIFEGGTFNAPRFDPQSAVTFTMSGGTFNVGTVANTRSNFGTFEVFSSSSTSNFNGGTINLINAAAAATPVDFRVNGTVNVNSTPTVLNVGTGATATNFNFRIASNTPSLVIDNTTTAKTATFIAQTLIRGNVTVNLGTTFAINGFLVATFGDFPTSFVNDGTVTGNTTGSRLYLNSTNPLTVSGSGTFGTTGSPLQSLDFDSAGGVTLNQTNQVITLRTILFRGNVTNSGKITLGDGGATSGIVQIGNTTTPTTAGVFDVPFTFNIGTGGQILSYLRVVDPRSTGPEINPSRIATSFTYDDNATDRSLTLAGGNLTVTGALTLTNGIIATQGNILEHNGAATRTNGYVNGNLRRTYLMPGAYTYHVGQNGYSPVAANVTASLTNLGSPGSLLVRANDSTLPGLNTGTSVSRYWTLTEGNSLTADLTFTYLDADVNGNEADYRVFKLDSGVLTNQCPGGPCVNEANNTATVTGITDFSDWGIGEAGAGAAGVLEFSSATYSADENAGTATITVTRTGGSGGAVTVDYASIAGGTATGGASCGVGIDYINAGGTLNFASGDTSETFNITLCPDTDFEPDETVNLALTNATGGATIGTQNTAVLTILNDDAAGLSGSYTVGTGGDYPSLTLPGGIFEAINNLGVTGNITINIISDLTGESGTVALNEFSGGFSILIRPNSVSPSLNGVPNRLITGSSTTAIIRLNGADNVTIDGSFGGGGSAGDVVGGDASIRNLTIQNTNTAPSTNEAVIFIQTGTNGAQNNTIKNVNILGQDPLETLIGIAIGGNTVGSSGADNDNNRVENCSFRRAFIGLYNAGTSAANQNTGNVATKNDMTGTGADRLRRAGMLFFNHDGLEVSLNSIGGIDTNESIDAYGIGVGTQAVSTTVTTSGGVTNSTITRNRITGVVSSSTVGFSAFGIGIAGGSTGANTISNNMISGVIAPSTSPDLVAGIFVTGATGSDTRLYHNSVSLTGNRGAVANQIGSYGIAITGSNPVVELKNNIFYNTQISGGGVNANTYSIGMVSTTFSNFNSNFNDFFASGANAQFFRTGSLASTGGTMYPNLAAFRAATSSDANSQEVDPLYVNPASDLHLQATSPVLDDGTPIAGVTIDIDGEMRSATTPDIGADEVAGAPNINVTPSSLSSTQAMDTTTIQTLMIGNTGTAGLNWSIIEDAGNAFASGKSKNTGPQPACSVPNDIPWLSVSPSMGTTSAGNSTDVTVTFNSTGLSNGTYNANLCVTSNDPDPGPGNGTDLVVVPVTLVVATPASISISDVSQAEGNAGTSTFSFDVSLSAASGQTVTVQYATADGSANAGTDYVAASGTVTFVPGDTTETIDITVNGDTTFEPDENFFVNLSSPTNATILDGQGEGTILNDDSLPQSLSVNNVRINEGNSGTATATFTVTLMPDANFGTSTVTVDYTTANGTAIAGTDYVATSGTVTFGPPSVTGTPMTQTINVTINGDTNKEANETFFVNLSNPVNATIADGQGVGIIIDEDRAYVSDFDNDKKTDYSVYRPSTGNWYVLQSTNNVPKIDNFGSPGDIAVPGDYDGDGITDRAFFRPSTGDWYVILSQGKILSIENFGLAGDVPVQGDYDGDGKTDRAVFRPSNGRWYILRSQSGWYEIQFGISTDTPVTGDFDGDAKNDLAIYRDGVWWILRSSDNGVTVENWGISTDIPVSGDFDGDGSSDLTVYRNGVWWILESLTNAPRIVNFGLSTDIPSVGDFDGDGTTDVSVFRPSSGDWYVLRSSDNTLTGVNWGANGDVPIPSAYTP